MEQRLGHDFRRVRVHSDPKAGRSAKALGARAFTLGNQIVFGAGRYQPQATSGKALLAHELVHVIQQGEAPALGNSSIESGSEGTIQRAIEGPTPGAGLPELGGEGSGGVVLDGDSPPGTVFTPEAMSINQRKWQDGEPFSTFGLPLDSSPETPSSESPTLMADRTLEDPPSTLARPPHIVEVRVDLSAQRMHVDWSNSRTTGPYLVCTGRGCPNTSGDPCVDPNQVDSYCTPTGTYKELKLGGENYVNSNGDSMCWYTQFEEERGIGIHNCQTVDVEPRSHGCVRVELSVAQMVHNNVIGSGGSQIVLSGTAPTRAWTLSDCKRVRKGYKGCSCSDS